MRVDYDKDQLAYALANALKERDEAREALADWENAAVHVEADHPDEKHCGCVSVLRKLLHDARSDRDELRGLEAMYQKVVAACLRCDPIPACQREDDQLEPPWEVIDRIRCERDEAREDAARWESSSDAMERAGAEQARRADENREWALKAEKERDEAREEIEALRHEYHGAKAMAGGFKDKIKSLTEQRDEARGHCESIVDKANELIARWDQPAWKDTAPTARFINALRIAVRAYEKGKK